MPVNKRDDFAQQNVEQWQENCDAIEGQRAIHKKGTKYLPELGSMDQKTKKGRKNFAEFMKKALYFNAVAKTVEGMLGLMFRKDAQNELPDAISYFSKNVDGTGMTIEEFERQVAFEVMRTNYVGLLTDHPQVESGMTVAQSEAAGLRPFLSMYTAENIFKVHESVVNNITITTMVVLRENVSLPSKDDEFEICHEVQYRVLDIFEVDGKMVYRQRLFDKDEHQVGDDYFPRMNGQMMMSIPFKLVSSANKPGRAPIEDLVKVNLHHYLMFASYAHGTYYTGFPTPTAVGIDKEDLPTGIGANAFWTSENKDAKFGMLEFTGTGLTHAKEYISDVEDKMAALGADMLKSQKMAAETEGSKRLDKQSQESTLSGIATVVEECIQMQIGLAAEWVGANPDDVSIKLNKDYNPTGMSPQMLQQLVGSWQSGAISFDTMFSNLQRGEIIKNERTAGDEKEMIEDGV